MSHLLTDLGEEWVIKTNLDTETVDVSLYNDSTDSIGDSNDLSAISTEPSGASFARQSASLTALDDSGDWGVDNDGTITFDTSDSTQSVDSWFLVANFQASDTGDGSATDHLAVTGALSKTYGLSGIDQFDLNSGATKFTIS